MFSFSSKSRGFKIGFKICHKNISEFPSLDEWIGKIDDSYKILSNKEISRKEKSTALPISDFTNCCDFNADSPQNNVSVPNALIFESQANQDAIFPSSTPVDSLPNMEGISTHLDIHDVKCSDSSSHISLQEALKDPCWIAAMEEELSALNTNDT